METPFSDLVLNIIQTSGKVAVRFKYENVLPEHLLLALIDECLKNPVEAAIVLKTFKELNIDLFDLIQDIETSFDDTQAYVIEGRIPISKKAEMILKLSFLEAKIFRSDIINAEHILLSYLRGQPPFYENILVPKYGLIYNSAKACVKRLI
jgi:ATP-dependent Clp protease ATP-binding subunit ClpC